MAVDQIDSLIFLQNLWDRQAHAFFASSDWATSVFDLLKQKHTEPHRAYHNLNHLKAIFTKASGITPSLKEDPIFQLVVWFHDSIYDPLKSDNELQSAKLALELLAHESCLLSEKEISQVEKVILATAKHLLDDSVTCCASFLDLDLSILGESYETYSLYTQQVRAEYQHVPEDLYRLGRSQVMSRFLERDSIYFTSVFQKKYELQARENIQRELRDLAG